MRELVSDVTTLAYAGVHTLVRMQPQQLAGMAARNVRAMTLPRLPVDFDRRYERQVPTNPSLHLDSLAANTATIRECLSQETRQQYRDLAGQAGEGSPTFLNQTLQVADDGHVDWYDRRFDELPLLWSLKLYAFQPLWWLCLGFEPEEPTARSLESSFDTWLGDWMSSVRIGEPGYLRGTWTPWAVSLRILYWSRYLAWRDVAQSTAGTDFEREIARALFKNALFLENHVEWDVGGNHLIENGAALVVAGVLFDRRKWIDTGTAILSETATNQFLDDGAHFERSPMYHVISLTRYLTVCDILERDGRPVPHAIRSTAAMATAHLRYLRPPDGELPLLNDSAHGQGLTMTACLRYATAMGFDEDSADEWIGPGDAVTTSGYRWLDNDVGSMLIDGGSVGPPHLPGHSHSDTLQVLLWSDDCPVVTDTGIFDYAADGRRRQARSVSAHNTVQVGDVEPITLAGKYLMGPRPEPTTRYEAGDVSLFEGRYEAEPYGAEPYIHHRAVFAGDDWWLLWDTVAGHEGRPVRSRLHLHPDVSAWPKSDRHVRIDHGRGELTAIPLNGTRFGIATGNYFPEFGVANSRQVLEFTHQDETSPATVGLLVTRDEPDEFTVGLDSTGAIPTEVIERGVSHSLPAVHLPPAKK